MSIEDEILKGKKIDQSKLIDYGFIKKDDGYYISKDIFDGRFKITIEIKKGIVKGEVYDKVSKDVYTNYRLNHLTGLFSRKVRLEFEEFLKDIKDKCVIDDYFAYPQANRLAKLIKNRFGDNPEFIFKGHSDFGVFRNSLNKKWYALIMNIPKNKIACGDEFIDVLNVKLPVLDIPNLLSKKGFYEAYHMNKKNWVSIILDDTLEDEEIMECITKSYSFTEKNI